MMSWLSPEVRWLWAQIRPLLRWHLASVGCIAVGSFLALASPLLLKWLIDDVLPGRSPVRLLLCAALLFLCYQGRATLVSLGSYLTLAASQRAALDLRRSVLRHLGTLSADYHEQTPSGRSIYPLKEPVDEIAYFASDLLPAILRMLVATFLTLGTMLLLSTRMTLIVMPLVPVFLVARKHFRDRLERDANTVQANRMAWNGFLQEHISSMVTLQLLRQQRRRERVAFRFLARSAQASQALAKTGVALALATSLAVSLAVSLVIACGGWAVLQGSLTMGGLVAFYTYMTQLFDPLSAASETYVRAQKAFASIRQVQSALAHRPSVIAWPGAGKFPGEAHAIAIRDLRFRYPAGTSGISVPCLTIAAGGHVAVVGANGAGKSTLAKLLARLYDVDSGSISIAGRDVRAIEIDSFRRQVCYAPPHPVLFDTTVRNNLRLGSATAGALEFERALQCVGLEDWAERTEENFDRGLGPGGYRLSGGQRQRLAIARAILQRPRILILDEATSSLDPASEQRLLLNLRKVLAGSTILTVSHRWSTVVCAERVIVLEAGQVVEDDRPANLIARAGATSAIFGS